MLDLEICAHRGGHSMRTRRAQSRTKSRYASVVEHLESRYLLSGAGDLVGDTRQTATNLLRDVDYALKRAGDLARIDAENQGDADVKTLQKRVA